MSRIRLLTAVVLGLAEFAGWAMPAWAAGDGAATAPDLSVGPTTRPTSQAAVPSASQPSIEDEIQADEALLRQFEGDKSLEPAIRDLLVQLYRQAVTYLRSAADFKAQAACRLARPSHFGLLNRVGGGGKAVLRAKVCTTKR